jgi:rare lipoprotein A
MSVFLRFIIPAFVVLLFTCGSFQTKPTEKSETSGDADDDFFKEEKPVLKASKENPQKKPESSADDSDIDVVSDVETGYAAWYGKELQGKPTASGEIFEMNKFTGAHRTYPMGSLVLVRNLENGKKKLVRVNDRGPYVDGRIIDVSYATARELDFVEKGVAKVEVELIEKGVENFLAKKTDRSENEDKDNAEDSLIDDVDGAVEKLSDLEREDYFFADGLRPRNYTVRTGAFKVPANAEKYREDLEDKYNLNAFLAKRGKWHFVWIGDFDDKETAKKFYKKLKTDGLDVLNPKKVQ